MVYTPYRRGAAADGGMNPREIEAAAFSMVNRALREAATPHQRVLALGRNHDLWSILVKDVASDSCALPPVLRDDILRLGLFSMRRSIGAMNEARPDLTSLIGINADMEAALRPQTVAAPPAAALKASPVMAYAPLAALSA